MERKEGSNELIHSSLNPIGCEYILRFILSNNSKLEFTPTFSTNMDIALGQLEYKLTESDALQILSNIGTNPIFNIICRTAEGDSTIYQGNFGSY